MKNWHSRHPEWSVMLYNSRNSKAIPMTEQELMELWGDGTEFGMSTLGAGVMTGAMNNAFREVAMKFAQRVAEIEYERGYTDGWDREKYSGLVGDPQ